MILNCLNIVCYSACSAYSSKLSHEILRAAVEEAAHQLHMLTLQRHLEAVAAAGRVLRGSHSPQHGAASTEGSAGAEGACSTSPGHQRGATRKSKRRSSLQVAPPGYLLSLDRLSVASHSEESGRLAVCFNNYLHVCFSVQH